jgi:hypothetical protein
VDQLYVRWKKHINKDMAVFIRYLGQVYSDMPTGTPEKEYISVAAKRYKEAQGKIFRFESCVPTLVQLARYSLHRFKRNNSTCLAVSGGANSGASLSDDDEEEEDGMVCDEDEDDNIDTEVTDASTTVAAPASVSVAPGRFLTASTYAPPPGKTTGTKKAKALQAAARASKRKGLLPQEPPPPSQASVAAELVAKSVSEMKIEIAKLAGASHDQLKLDEEKLKLEEVKLKLEEVNTYIRLGMTEEAASSMAAFSAFRKKLLEDRLTVTCEEEQQEPKKKEEDDCCSSNLLEEPGNASVNLLEEEQEDIKETVFLEEDTSSESSLSSFRFRRPKRKQKMKEDNNVVPESVVVDATPGSPLFPSVVNHRGRVVQESTTPEEVRELILKRKKRRMEKRAAIARVVQSPLLDRTNVGPPDEVEVDWHHKQCTQLTIPEDLQSTHSGSVCYRGDTQRE